MDELLPTEGTTFWLVFMNLLVPLHLGFRLEYFSAMTDKIFLRRNLIQMVSVSVLSQIREPTEVLITVGTLDRCLSCVNSHVFDKFLLDYKLLPAKSTLMVFDAQMSFDV